ncbi:DUF4832 domain-containing protein [Paenibacillus sp. GYB003]|uniref:DUF4832 domain-containing protein n=1 Tax=Paenibacillus sp. GYB003 TaxID=2994392 RepID=UPI002F96694F
MNRQRIYRSLLFFAVLAAAALSGRFAYDLLADAKNSRVSYMPAETDQVLANPFMGFAVDAKYTDAKQPFRLAHVNLTWREIEPKKGSYAFDNFEQKFNVSLWRSRGVHLVLRVILDYPREETHMDIPDWLYEEIDRKGTWYDGDYGKGFSPDYGHPALIENHERLLAALGKRFNDDPLIAYIQLGSVGHWGEWHTSDDERHYIPFPKRDITDQYANHYVRSFPDKHLLMRRPHEIARVNGMGLFNDAFGKRKSTIEGFLKWYTEGYTSWLTGEPEPAMPDFWTKAPSGGEFATGANYFDDHNIEETLRQAALTHVTWMGPSAPYKETNRALQPNIDRFLKTIGYRFVINEETHPKTAVAGKSLDVSMRITNRGAAPFYFEWPLELSLASADGSVATSVRTTVDIREWLPGEHQVSYPLPLPKQLPAGTYTVLAAVLDPQTGKPGIEFANDGKRSDGRYALGTVAVKSGN